MNLMSLLLFLLLTVLILRNNYCSSYHLPRNLGGVTTGRSTTSRTRTTLTKPSATSTTSNPHSTTVVMSMVVPTTTVNLSTPPSWVNVRGDDGQDDNIQKNEHSNNAKTKSKKNKKKSGGGDEILLTGRSRAGQSTSWFLPRYKTLVDVGCIVDSSVPKIILLTHTHADHVQCLMDIINHKLPPRRRMFQQRVNRQREQANRKQPMLKVYLPVEAEPFVRNFIIASQSMYDCGVEDGNDTDDDDDDDDDDDKDYDDTENDNDIGTNDGTTDDDSATTSTHTNSDIDLVYLGLDSRIELCPIRPGDVIELGTSQDRLKIDVLKMTHRIPCVGYSMSRCKRRLKSQYIGLPGREIGQLRKSIGDDIYETFEEPLVCIMGDTTSQVFEDYPEILQQHSYVVVECTFLQSKDRSRAEITKHMLWDDLEPYIVQNPTTMFMLTHFSLRHSTISIREKFCEIQRMYPNVHPLIVEDEIEQQWSKTMNNIDDDDDDDDDDENKSSKKKKKKKDRKKRATTTQRIDGVDGGAGDDNKLNTPPRCQCNMCLSFSPSSSSYQ